jgi:hypothetical protein
LAEMEAVITAKRKSIELQEVLHEALIEELLA